MVLDVALGIEVKGDVVRFEHRTWFRIWKRGFGLGVQSVDPAEVKKQC